MKKILFLILLLVCRSLISEAQPNTDLRFNSGKGISWNQGSKLFSIDGSAELRGNVFNFRTLSDAVKFSVDSSGNINITGDLYLSSKLTTNQLSDSLWKISNYDTNNIFRTDKNNLTSSTMPIDFNSGFDDTLRKIDGGSLNIVANTLNAAINFSTSGEIKGYAGGVNYWYVNRFGAGFFAGGITQNGKLIFQNYLYQTQLEGGNRKADSASWQSGTVGNLYFNKNGTFNKSIYVKETSSGNTGWSAIKTSSADVSPGTTGTVSIPMTRSVYTLTPTGNITLNASDGQTGNTCILYITTSGTTDYRITFGTNFKTTGPLDMGIISGKVFTIMFVCKDGTTWAEISRTPAM